MKLKLFDNDGAPVGEFDIDHATAEKLCEADTAVRLNDKVYTYNDTDGDTYVEFGEVSIFDLSAGGEPSDGENVLYGRQIG